MFRLDPKTLIFKEISGKSGFVHNILNAMNYKENFRSVLVFVSIYCMCLNGLENFNSKDEYGKSYEISIILQLVK
jgi:hypothetical protein